MAANRQRLDEIVVARGWAASRAQAKALILAGKVRHGTTILDKAGKEFPGDIALDLIAPPRFVSRGGDKLAGFLAEFPVPVAGVRALDVGASTGGFTDCLLQAGASAVVCIDVGHGQLHYKLQTDPRVISFEGVNARALETVSLPWPDYDVVVMDLSFISLRKVLVPVWPRVRPGGTLIALVKPQFEAGRAEADAGRGIITDPLIHDRVLGEIRTWVADHLPTAREVGCCPSPITGTSGNREFLIGWRADPLAEK
jgi:23S rRNA (cytidine1920-2'-O)/16S rRNA (cytidine1409-2'-O)-methyltransferase